jgi:hypothetical protein
VRLMLSVLSACLALTMVLVASPVLADPGYLPLGVGNTWSYEGSGDEAETMTVIGTAEVLGETVYVIDYSASSQNEPLENYWTSGPDGEVLLWGFFRDEDGGWGMAYSPPILWVDAPTFAGAVWACTTQIYSLPSETPDTVAVFEYTVTWEGILSPPAGSFEAIAVGFVTPWQRGVAFRGYSADGRALTGRTEPDRWYSDGVGLIQYDATELYELVSYGTSPVELATWTRVKLLYR